MKRIIGAALAVALATGVAACSDMSSPSRPDETTLNAPAGTFVSNALTTPSSVSSTGLPSSLAVSASRVAYVSVVPGTFSQALSVSVRNQTTGGASKLVDLSDGGFDPVGIDAEADDELSITAYLAGGGLTVITVKVPVRRPPGVVRTSPGKGRIDVALNVHVLVVFSEPVQPSSVTSSSFALRRDGNIVSGKVQVSADGLSAEFIPDSPLQPETTYELAVDRSIRDLQGDALDVVSTVSFTTSGSWDPYPTGSVAGFVIDEDDYKAHSDVKCIIGARVEVIDGPRAGELFVQTVCGYWDYGADLGYSFSRLPLGIPVTLRATATGYKPAEIRVTPTNPYSYSTWIVLTKESSATN